MGLVIGFLPFAPDAEDEEIVNEPNKTTRSEASGSPAIIRAAALVAVLAGFATVYWSFAPSDNGWLAKPSGAEAPKAAGSGSGAGPLAGLNTGAMAAFVAKRPPQAVPEITIVAGDGETKSLADWRGRVVLLNIWATWCVPCREEMPQLDTLQADLGGENFEVVAVNVDKGGGDKAKIFLEETGAAHLARYTDPSGRLFRKVRAVGMPTTLLIDRDGKEIGRLVGPADWGSEQAKMLIEAAIAAPASP
jgi:thiol-disulfide isomerase/thioredoxin